MGPRVKMRQTEAVAKKCVDEVQDRLTSIGPLLGKAFASFTATKSGKIASKM